MFRTAGIDAEKHTHIVPKMYPVRGIFITLE